MDMFKATRNKLNNTLLRNLMNRLQRLSVDTVGCRFRIIFFTRHQTNKCLHYSSDLELRAKYFKINFFKKETKISRIVELKNIRSIEACIYVW